MVILGCANQAGEDNRNVARMAALLAGLPETVPRVTLNRLCAPGLDEVPRIAAEIRAGRTESLRIATMPRIAQSLSAPAVARFFKKNPHINISLDVRARREAGKWLAGREYDIGIGALPVEHPGIRTRRLLRVRAQAILPADHKLAKRRELATTALVNEPIIRLMQGLLLRYQLDDIFHSAGVSPGQSCEVAS